MHDACRLRQPRHLSTSQCGGRQCAKQPSSSLLAHCIALHLELEVADVKLPCIQILHIARQHHPCGQAGRQI